MDWRCIAIACCFACGGKPQQQTAASESTVDPSTDQGPASCEQGRCLADISGAILQQRAKTRACYDAGRKRQPTIEGRLIINFKIGPDGEVSETSQGMQDDQITEPGVVECVSEVIKNIKFAKSPAGKSTRAYHLFEFTR